MRVYGVIGWKNAGKTSLMERLVAEITGRGHSVSTVKHVHHDVDLDQPGKDSFRHRAAGAREVILASAHRFALMREHRGPEPDLTEVLSRLAPVDLVLVEGYKRDAHRKVEVFRQEAGHSLIQPGDPLVRAVAADCDVGALPVPVLDLNDTAAVADFILDEVGLPRIRPAGFDAVMVVDWSAAGKPTSATRLTDAIWIGCCDGSGETQHHFRTRAQAETFLAGAIAKAGKAGQRLLIGFDFAFGYPAGFARRLTGQDSAPAVWAWLDRHITDRPDNANNRFSVADSVNAGFPGAGPFWSRPTGLDLPHLPDLKAGIDYAALGLAEFRQVERQVKGAKSVWMLSNPGAVGSQSLMGLPMIHRLSRMPGVAAWPFDPPDALVVLAEVYPSLLAQAVAADNDTVKDRAQVRLLSRALWRLNVRGDLPDLLATPGPPVTTEEGWILGAGQADRLKAAL